LSYTRSFTYMPQTEQSFSDLKLKNEYYWCNSIQGFCQSYKSIIKVFSSTKSYSKWIDYRNNIIHKKIKNFWSSLYCNQNEIISVKLWMNSILMFIYFNVVIVWKWHLRIAIFRLRQIKEIIPYRMICKSYNTMKRKHLIELPYFCWLRFTDILSRSWIWRVVGFMIIIIERHLQTSDKFTMSSDLLYIICSYIYIRLFFNSHCFFFVLSSNYSSFFLLDYLNHYFYSSNVKIPCHTSYPLRLTQLLI